MIESSRTENIAALAHVSRQTVCLFIGADWDNQDEHQAWLRTATDQEIAEWIQNCTRHGEEDKE